MTSAAAPRALLVLFGIILVAEGVASAAPSSLPYSRPLLDLSPTDTSRRVLVVSHADEKSEPVIEAIIDALAEGKRYRVQRLETLLPLMRRNDDARDVPGALSRDTRAARQAMLALDWKRAGERLDSALKVSTESFLALYDPRRVANIHVLRGTVALQRAQPERARHHFNTALHLAPRLKLDAYHSPQIRAAVAETRAHLPARPLPSASLMRRILALPGAAPQALILSGARRPGERILLKAVLFSREGTSLRPLEATSTPANPTIANRRAGALGGQLREQLEALFPALSQPASTQATTLPETRPIPPAPPAWYRRWYVWVAVGAVVVAGAVAVPLLTRERVVDVNVSW